MFWQLTNGLFSLNFAVSFGVLVKWSKLDTKLFSYIGFKIPNPTRMKSQIILLHRTSDNFQELFFFSPSLFQCGLPLLQLHKCYFLVYVCSLLFPSHTEKKKKRLLNFPRSFLLYTEYNTISWIFITLCPTYTSEGWKQMYLHVVFTLFSAAPFLNSKYQFHR